MNSLNNWTLRVERAVVKEIAKFPDVDADRLHAVIDSLATDPYAGDIQKLHGLDREWRRRVGAYRIFYLITEERLVWVYHVERRTSGTY